MNRFRLSRILRPSLAANEQMTLQARRLIDREIYFQHECNVGFWFFFYHRTASLSNFCIRSSFSMLQLHSGGMHHEQWWVWLQDGGKAIDALMHGITISASVSRKQKEMIVDFRRDGNSQPTCTLDEQLWEWSPALEVPRTLTGATTLPSWLKRLTSAFVFITYKVLLCINSQQVSDLAGITTISLSRQFLSWLTNGPISSWAPLTAQGGAGHHTSHSGRSLDVNL